MLQRARTCGVFAAATKLGFDANQAKMLAKAFGVGAVPGAIAGAIGSGEDHRLSGALMGGATGGMLGAAGHHIGSGMERHRNSSVLNAPHPGQVAKQRMQDLAEAEVNRFNQYQHDYIDAIKIPDNDQYISKIRQLNQAQAEAAGSDLGRVFGVKNDYEHGMRQLSKATDAVQNAGNIGRDAGAAFGTLAAGGGGYLMRKTRE